MAYNPFPVGYQPYYQQSYNQPYNQNQQAQSSNGIIWVSGEAGAKAYMVAPNNTVVLFDSENEVIYLKSADASGMPSIKTLDYTIREAPTQARQKASEQHFATVDDITYLKAEIERIKEDLGYGKPTVQGNEQRTGKQATESS